MKIAVVAHKKKTLGGGLVELREVLARHGFGDPLWFEVPKSRKAPKCVKRAVESGVDRIFVWGGDGMVQRSLDVLAGTGVTMAVVPAGTGNLFASNLSIPIDLEQAVAVGLHGDIKKLDVGVVNGEHFGVMAGVGADALMIRDADRGLKDRFGRGAYVATGLRNLPKAKSRVKVRVDGAKFYSGPAGCVLVGNVGKVLGGIRAFEDASPTDGKLDLGVVTAQSPVQWGRVVTGVMFGRTKHMKYVKTTSATSIDIRLIKKMVYQVDGGDRTKVRRLKIRVQPNALSVCVPGLQSN